MLDGLGDLTQNFAPEDVLHYIYAVLHSPKYRSRYAEFLKIDFPRIPLPTDLSAFVALVHLGRELSGLHLMNTELESGVTFPEAGLNVVDKPRHAAQKVWINDTQYFAGIPETLWQTRIGGYQVLEKWLKDRKGRELSFDDISHYCQVAAALEQTQVLMQNIDAVLE